MASDNRKTFRLDDESQSIITELKEKRGCTENDVVNFLIKQYPVQGKKITELHNQTVELNQKLDEKENIIKTLTAEIARIKNAFSVIRSLFDSSTAPDQESPVLGPK